MNCHVKQNSLGVSIVLVVSQVTGLRYENWLD